jgi:hypothetical protein
MAHIDEWEYDPKTSEFLPKNEAAREIFKHNQTTGNTTLTHGQHVARRKALKISESVDTTGSADPLGPGWVKVPLPTKTQHEQASAFRRMGFSEAAAAVAAGLPQPK